jgi:arsenical pump membrane protein
MHARGLPRRLFLLVYGVGTLVTVFMSNDATVVVLAPAVFAAARKAKLEPLPYVYVCAFTANAASFVLPIPNPANLLVFNGAMPGLTDWLARFALASLLSIVATYVVLHRRLRREIEGRFLARAQTHAAVARRGRRVWGHHPHAITLLSCSFARIDVGLPTASVGSASRRCSRAEFALAAAARCVVERHPASRRVVRAGRRDRDHRRDGDAHSTAALQSSVAQAAVLVGAVVALVCNLMNNLPVGLIAASAIAQAQPPTVVADAILIGVDLGPNLSITGSLATILWLIALRREERPCDDRRRREGRAGQGFDAAIFNGGKLQEREVSRHPRCERQIPPVRRRDFFIRLR